jgi:formate-dependent nitrite reductase membrane component NrfD
MRVKTPARISSAANSAATTAQLSTDNNQLFRELSVAGLVLIALSLLRPSTHRGMPRAILARLVAPKLFADFLDLL